MKSNLIGYVFGYKQTKSKGNTFAVEFCSGTSDKIPKCPKHAKDFWFEPIRENQVCNLYIDPDEYIKFCKESSHIETESVWIESSFNEHKWQFVNPPTLQTYRLLYAWYINSLNYLFQTWESPEVERLAFQ